NNNRDSSNISVFFFFSSRRRHTRFSRDWSSDVCSSDLKEGGKILCGGKRVTVKNFENGYYLEPTVIEVFDDQCRVNQEEIFGPRSEERRVGKECRSLWAPSHLKEKMRYDTCRKRHVKLQ